MGKLPENVEDAVGRMDNACISGRVMPSDDAWQTIRAELTRLTEIADGVDPLVVRLGDVTAENERLRDKADKFMWQVRDTCTRAEKAEAMLRDIAGCQWFAREAPATVELIVTHLSEPRT